MTPFINFFNGIPKDLSIVYKNEAKDKDTRDKRISSLAFRIIGALATLTAVVAALAGISLILNARVLSGMLMLTFAAVSRVFGFDATTIGTNQRALLKHNFYNSFGFTIHRPNADAPPIELQDTVAAEAIYELSSPKCQKKVRDYFNPPSEEKKPPGGTGEGAFMEAGNTTTEEGEGYNRPTYPNGTTVGYEA